METIESKWSKDEQIINELYTDGTDQGGKKPKPLKTSWMMRNRICPPDRKSIEMIAVDVDDETICMTDCLEKAISTCQAAIECGYNACIRPVVLSEKDFVKEETERKPITQYQRGF